MQQGPAFDNIAMLAVDKKNLGQTKSTFLTDDIIVANNSIGTIVAEYAVMGFGFVLIYIAIATLQYNPTFFKIVLLAVGAAFIYMGASKMRLLRSLERLPQTNVSKAQDGLNMIQGNLIAENKALTSSISNTSCIFYQIDLQEWVHSGKTSYWETIATFSRGAPALIDDTTGYLALDLENADLMLSGGTTRYYALDSEGELALSKTPQGQDLMRYMVSNPFEFDPSTVGVQLGNPTKNEWEIFKGAELSFVERTIPMASGVAIGRVIDTHKTLNGKPVKAMVYDKKTRMLAFKNETEKAFEHSASVTDYGYIAIGIALAAFGLFMLII